MRRSTGWLLFPLLLLTRAAAAPPRQAALPAGAEKYVQRGPLDIPELLRQRRATVSQCRLDSGSLEDVFDGNPRTAVRPAAAPGGGFIQVVLDRPRAVDQADVTFNDAERCTWLLTAAATTADMQRHAGSYRALCSARTVAGDEADQVAMLPARAYRVYRLEWRHASGATPAALAEWMLWAPQELSRIEASTFAPTLSVGSKLQLRAHGSFEAGAKENLTPEASWEVSPAPAGHVDEQGRFEAAAPGPAQVTALFAGKRSAPLRLEVLPRGLPDWDVTYIERQPRCPCDDASGQPKPGQNVYWFGHVKNYGTADADRVPLEWRLDGQVVRQGLLSRLERFSQTETILTLPWDGKRHEIELVIDPRGETEEVTRANNRLRIYSDAQPVGFWVEDSVLRYFHAGQKELQIGSNSWEDWAQRQVEFWNRWSGATRWLTNGGAARETAPPHWRLDRIVVVGDGMLPLAGTSRTREPDVRDRTVQVMCGFPATEVLRRTTYGCTNECRLTNPFYCQASLFSALTQLRFPLQASVPPATNGPPLK